jgi:hypothetical protein
MKSKELLEAVIESNLKIAQEHAVGTEEHNRAYKEAMEGIDRCIELDKIEDKKKEQKESKIVKYIEIAIIPAGLVVLDYVFKYHFMKTVCNFEKEYTFTTTPGRSISSLFRFKK